MSLFETAAPEQRKPLFYCLIIQQLGGDLIGMLIAVIEGKEDSVISVAKE